VTGPDVMTSCAAVVASLGALARVPTHRRARQAGALLLLLGWIGLLVGIAPESVRDQWIVAAPSLAVLVALGWLVAGRLVGRERWLVAVGGFVLAIRVPVPTGDGTAMLLAPLYVVIALGALVLLRGELARSDTLEDRGGATRLLDVGSAALPIIATLSLTWSIDRPASAETLGFFLVPFVLAYALVRSWAERGVDLRGGVIGFVSATLVAALVGLYQAVTYQVWWNPKVVDANRFRPDFRTNSIFWDPNIYGRVLVLGSLAVLAWLLATGPGRRATIAGCVSLVVLLTALWHTYSQSSWFALAGALIILGVLTTPPRPRRLLGTLLVIVVVVGVPFAASSLGGGSDAAGREQVVQTGISLAGEKPVLGWGMGAFETAARARAFEQGDRTGGLTASHTTPVTVLAELGVLGMVAYLTLLASAAVAVLARWRRSSTPAAAARARGDLGAMNLTGWPIAPIIWATGVFVALLAHSLLYAGFFEDPALWVALALLASLPVVGPDVGTVTGTNTDTEIASGPD